MGWTLALAGVFRDAGAAVTPLAAAAAALPPGCPAPQWPMEARRYELEGVTGLDYVLAEDGRVVDIRLVQSSGWLLLDRAALLAAHACKPQDAPSGTGKPRGVAVRYSWALEGGIERRPPLIPNSCAPSKRFAHFRPLDKRASGADGILVRFLIDAKGVPFKVRAESANSDVLFAAEVASYVESCRFAMVPSGPGATTDTGFGRVQFHAVPRGAGEGR